MGELKIVLMLKLLSIAEQKRFVSFAQGKSQKEEEILVLEYLLESINKKTLVNKGHTEKLLHATNKKRNSSTKLFSKLVNWVEDFLATEQLGKQQHELLKHTLLIERLREKGDEKMLVQAIKKARRAMEGQEEYGLLFFHIRRWLVDELFFDPALAENAAAAKHIEGLDSYFSLVILHYACRDLSHKRINHSTVSTPLLENVLKLSEQVTVNEIPLLTIYQLGVKLFLAFDEDMYLEFKRLSLDRLKSLRRKECLFLFKLLINHTAHAIRLDDQYTKYALEVYRFGIMNNLLEEGGFLVKEHFINYINLACNIQRVRTAKVFLKENQLKLHDDQKKTVLAICRSRIWLGEGKFRKAFGSLFNIRFTKDSPMLVLIGRSNRLMACFDWDANDEKMEIEGNEIFLEEEMDAFRLVLFRLKQKLGTENERVLANERFLAMTRKISRLPTNTKISHYKEQLKNELASIASIACRGWLLQKIKAL